VVTEAGFATALWAADLGWNVFDSDAANLALTNAWVIGLTNAFNLMDNMDGAASTVASVTGVATGVLAIAEGDVALAALCFGLAGACLGFLRYNLAGGGARIFLGDGGSLPIGLVLAATIMTVPGGEANWELVLAASILAGLPVVDTALVMISRRRSGVPVLRGGRDHLTHRLLPRLATPRQVALTLALLQAGLGALAIGVVQLGRGELIVAWCIWFITVAFAVALLESEAWAPARPDGNGGRRLPRPARTVVEGAVIVFITFACGVSPLLDGFYDTGVWAPITLVSLAALFGLVVARPAAPRRAALVALVGLALLWLWALLSTAWSESADEALTDANRWLLYAVLFAILILLLRSDRLARILLASATAAVVGVALYLTVALLTSDGPSLFVGNRLDEPIGYVNGQAGYLLLGFWPLVAVAERARSLPASAGAVGAATLLAGLVVLTETRAAVLAFAITAAVLVAILPGRTRRLWVLVAVLAGVAAMALPLVDVYNSQGAVAGRPDAGTLRTGVVVMVLVSALAGLGWALGNQLVSRWAATRPTGRLRPATLSTAALVGLVVLALGGATAAAGNPLERLGNEVDSFVSLNRSETDTVRENRFTSAGDNRYDYWRVAVEEFKSAPVHGVGAGNYSRDYFVERRTLEDVTQPHSIELQTLAELGVLGVVFLILFLSGIAGGLRERAAAARRSPADLALVVAAAGIFLTWFTHTSVDWLHEIPGVTGIALCAAAVLVAPWRTERASSGGRARLVVAGLCALAVVTGVVTVGRAALADRYRSQAEELVDSRPAEALAKAEDSLELNDEALNAYIVKATAYARLGDYQRARASLLEAGRREPHDFVPHALLGDLAVRRCEFWLARDNYMTASALNPRDPGLQGLASDPFYGTYGTPDECKPGDLAGLVRPR
jgi:UDP-N-acetylmuramyl pentapeptide phosphotransferase/UDP-N-acetylglucosamine-1-phosphate transferase